MSATQQHHQPLCMYVAQEVHNAQRVGVLLYSGLAPADTH
jgi:hypothetical protein